MFSISQTQHLRADLKEVLYRHKWRPEGVPSAKTVASDSGQSKTCARAELEVGAEADMNAVMQGQKILPFRAMMPTHRKL